MEYRKDVSHDGHPTPPSDEEQARLYALPKPGDWDYIDLEEESYEMLMDILGPYDHTTNLNDFPHMDPGADPYDEPAELTVERMDDELRDAFWDLAQTTCNLLGVLKELGYDVRYDDLATVASLDELGILFEDTDLMEFGEIQLGPITIVNNGGDLTITTPRY